MPYSTTTTSPKLAQTLNILMAIFIFSLVSRTVLAFDTAWHYTASAEVAKTYKFTTYSTDLLHIGTWGPDYYQVFQVLIGKYLENLKNHRALALIPGIKRTRVWYAIFRQVLCSPPCAHDAQLYEPR